MKIQYRPEIDGLRAIAVVAVILYHAQISVLDNQIFKGGYIGVDIFFVISGYLITSIILKELILFGSLSFKYFYERRIRRILPALLFVMLASIPFAWMYLMPSSFVEFSKSILYSLGFSSNFYFHYSGQQYAAESSLLIPFLHTWSLSVEEQYYIIFPLILFIIFKYFNKNLLIILVIGFITSLLISNWGSKYHSSASFYFLLTRMWELLAGSILAYFEIIKGRSRNNQTLNLGLSSFGLFLIVASILFFDDKIPHPSFYTLLPILGVSLIIWFSHKNELTTKILSTKLFVGIGLISYSLYLWHYPILAFARITDFIYESLFNKLSLGLILFLFSIFTYYFVEKPSRNRKNKFKYITSFIIIIILFLSIFSINIVHKEGYQKRLPEIFKKNLFVPPWDLLKNTDGKKCFGNIEGCKFNTSSIKKIYLIGDSHMASLKFDLKERLVKNNYQFVFFNCGFYPGFDKFNIKTQKVDEICSDDYFQKLKQALSQDKNSIIIFGGRYPQHLSNYYFDNQEGGIEGEEWHYKYVPVGKYNSIGTSFNNELLELSKNNKIILIYPIPEVGWDVPNKLLYLIPKKKDLIKDYLVPENYIATSYEVFKKRTKLSFEMLDSIQSNNIYRVYPHKLFCDTIVKNRCITHDDKNIFYFDDNHPSLKGSEMINDLIMREVKKIELTSK